MGEAATAILVPPTRALRPIAGVISGFTRHGITQAVGREGAGVSSRAILDAGRNPVRVRPQSGGRVRYDGRDGTVVVNHRGEVITTWARNRQGIRNQ